MNSIIIVGCGIDMTKELIGKTAPNFTLESSTGGKISLSDYDGKWKVLFFYAKDGSPTCKRGCLNFKEQYDLFQSLTPPVEINRIAPKNLNLDNLIKKINVPY